eukprot:4729501-Amphidinium_carterae.2
MQVSEAKCMITPVPDAHQVKGRGRSTNMVHSKGVPLTWKQNWEVFYKHLVALIPRFRHGVLLSHMCTTLKILKAPSQEQRMT